MLSLRMTPLLRQRPSLRLMTSLECPVCRRNIDPAQAGEDRTAAALFGAERYAVCFGCDVAAGPELMADRGYRARWTRRQNRRRQK